MKITTKKFKTIENQTRIKKIENKGEIEMNTENKKTIAEIIEEGNKIEAQIEYKYKNQKIPQNWNIDHEGVGDILIFNGVQGWVTKYYAGWSYQDADKNSEVDYEQILVEAIENSYNFGDIQDRVYDSVDGEEWDVILETDTEEEEMYEVQEVPRFIEVKMKVTFSILD